MNIKPPVLVTAKRQRFSRALYTETDSILCMAMYLRMIKANKLAQTNLFHNGLNWPVAKRRQLYRISALKQVTQPAIDTGKSS